MDELRPQDLPSANPTGRRRRRRSPEERLQGILSLLRLAEDLGNVSEACRLGGYSRDSYYRFRRLVALGGEAALALPDPHRPHIKKRLPEATEAAAVAVAREHGDWGVGSVVHELQRRKLTISPTGVRHAWRRRGFVRRRKQEKTVIAPSGSGNR